MSKSYTATSPPAAKLEKSLRDAVRTIYKNGNTDDLTVKRIRKAVETNLLLDEDFFKNDQEWKTASKDIIQSEVVRIF